MMRFVVRILCCFVLFTQIALASAEGASLKKVAIDLKDKAALQRGAKLFMNYCSGCHSLSYLRYNRLAQDLNLMTFDGEVDKDLLKHLMFANAKPGDPIRVAMPKKDAKEWFGIAPPDLTLEARVRGADWLYSYLLSFYVDQSRLFGVNNTVFPGVAMPNVLANLQGRQIS